MLIKIAIKSLWNRKGSVMLTMMAIVISVTLLMSVEQLRKQAKDSFGRTVSGVDLIIGARSGQLNLLLSSVFRMGTGTQAISWESYQLLANSKHVSWAIPVTLGDSHGGFSVLGTEQHYFDYFRYGNKQLLEFEQGARFEQDNEVVIGSDVAKSLGYSLGQSVVLSHGTGKVSFTQHKQHPFVVTGILAPTGTPVDKTLHISLAGVEAVHATGSKGYNKIPDKLTAVFVGLKSRIAALQLQRQVNEHKGEALQAILPGVALAELWRLMGTVENILRVISILILISSLFGMSTMLLASMRERQRELAVLRALGAGPQTLFILLQAEALIISACGCLLSMFSVWSVAHLSVDFLSENYGLFIEPQVFTSTTFEVVGLVMAATVVIGLIPAISAYRRALHAGLTYQ